MTDVLAEAAALKAARRPFAIATVVWRRAPSSGQVGAKAIIGHDGSVRGWLGGACSEPTVLREARAALADGQPRLLLLGSPDELEAYRRDGMVTVPMACESEGALEVFLEPVLPAPRVIAIGRSPAVHALCGQTVALGWDCTVIDVDGDPSTHPHPELVRTTLDLDDVDSASAIVIATQGHYDDLALRAALATDAGYIGVVAAEKRASTLLALLRDEGFADDQLARVEAPAGLDLGRVANAEISAAVLAGLVARRATGELRTFAAPPPPAEAIDPVCGMTVLVNDAKHHAVHDGIDYWFCAAGCRRAFERAPGDYV